MELGKGEALVSFLEGNGTPSIVQRAMIRPPAGRMGPITPQERRVLVAKSPLKGKYDETVDSESASEMLQKRVKTEAAPPGQAPEEQSSGGGIGGWLGGIFGTNR